MFNIRRKKKDIDTSKTVSANKKTRIMRWWAYSDPDNFKISLTDLVSGRVST